MTKLETSYSRGATDKPLIEQTIGAFFDEIVGRFPDKEAVVSCHQGIRYTYLELQREVNRMASALLRMGLEPGDRIGIW
ncbi:MAG TPA: AMP-binding protein, partial [Burkholderiaceae bacterium]|nr:AMP-binding protein [Burkholderiaceae bacterium]